MTVKIDSANVRIVPLCSERITVVGEPNPKYDANGVSRDRSITVEFSKEPAASNFIFTEIPAGAEAIKNEKEEIWAYTLNSQRFFKNIKITNADGYSIAEHFRQPVIDGKLLTIETDKSDPIQFGVGETIKTVIVTLSSDICAADGVTKSLLVLRKMRTISLFAGTMIQISFIWKIQENLIQQLQFWKKLARANQRRLRLCVLHDFVLHLSVR